jgi:hypothetical protein
MPKFCPNCGSEISEKVNFCPECGSDIETFSVKKSDKPIVEETKKEIKIEDKQFEKKRSPSKLVIYGIIGVVIVILLLAAISYFSSFSTAMNENIKRSSTINPTPTIITTTQIVVTTTQTGVAPTVVTTTPKPWPKITPVQITRIPVVPAVSVGNEPSVAEKAKFSTVGVAQSWALSTADQYGITQTPQQTTRPLIHAYTNNQDSRLDLTNRDTYFHIYYVEVNFYNGDTPIISNTGQWNNNGYSWYVKPGQTVISEIIPPEKATSYEIKTVAIVTTKGFFETDYDLDLK